MSEKDNFDVDEALERLEQINKKLSEKDVTLEDSINLYEKGKILVKQCQDHLAGVEKKLEIVNE